MYSAEGNVIDYNTGAKRSIIPTQEEIERSDSLREEAWEGIENPIFNGEGRNKNLAA